MSSSLTENLKLEIFQSQKQLQLANSSTNFEQGVAETKSTKSPLAKAFDNSRSSDSGKSSSCSPILLDCSFDSGIAGVLLDSNKMQLHKRIQQCQCILLALERDREYFFTIRNRLSKITNRKKKQSNENEFFCNVCCADIDPDDDKTFVKCYICQKYICRSIKCADWLPKTAEWECELCQTSKESLAQTSSWVADQISFHQEKLIHPPRARSEIYIPISECNDSSIHFESVSQIGANSAMITAEQKLKIREYVEEVVAKLLGGNLDTIAVNQLSKSENYLPNPKNDLSHNGISGESVRARASNNDFTDISETRLRQMIQKIIAETISLPPLSKTHAVSEIALDRRSKASDSRPLTNGYPRHRTEHYFEPTIYQDLLATAVLNKIVDKQLNNNHEVTESDTGGGGGRDGEGEEVNDNIRLAESDQNFNIEKLSTTSGSSVEPQSDCSYPEMEQLLNTNDDKSSELIRNSDRDSVMSDYLASHLIPLPDLNAMATESEEEDYMSVTSSAIGDGTWEKNWLFKKKKSGLSSSVTTNSVGMLVPDPKEDVRAQIGDKTADEVSDLSELGSDTDDSLDSLRSKIEPINDRLANKHLIGGQNNKMVLDELIERSSMISNTLQSNQEILDACNEHVIDAPTTNEAINDNVTQQECTLEQKGSNLRGALCSVVLEDQNSNSLAASDDTTESDGCIGFSAIEIIEPTPDTPSVVEILAAMALGPMLAVPSADQPATLTVSDFNVFTDLKELALAEIKARSLELTPRNLDVIPEETADVINQTDSVIDSKNSSTLDETENSESRAVMEINLNSSELPTSISEPNQQVPPSTESIIFSTDKAETESFSSDKTTNESISHSLTLKSTKFVSDNSHLIVDEKTDAEQSHTEESPLAEKSDEINDQISAESEICHRDISCSTQHEMLSSDVESNDHANAEMHINTDNLSECLQSNNHPTQQNEEVIQKQDSSEMQLQDDLDSTNKDENSNLTISIDESSQTEEVLTKEFSKELDVPNVENKTEEIALNESVDKAIPNDQISKIQTEQNEIVPEEQSSECNSEIYSSCLKPSECSKERDESISQEPISETKTEEQSSEIQLKVETEGRYIEQSSEIHADQSVTVLKEESPEKQAEQNVNTSEELSVDILQKSEATNKQVSPSPSSETAAECTDRKDESTNEDHILNDDTKVLDEIISKQQSSETENEENETISEGELSGTSMESNSNSTKIETISEFSVESKTEKNISTNSEVFNDTNSEDQSERNETVLDKQLSTESNLQSKPEENLPNEISKALDTTTSEEQSLKIQTEQNLTLSKEPSSDIPIEIKTDSQSETESKTQCKTEDNASNEDSKLPNEIISQEQSSETQSELNEQQLSTESILNNEIDNNITNENSNVLVETICKEQCFESQTEQNITSLEEQLNMALKSNTTTSEEQSLKIQTEQYSTLSKEPSSDIPIEIKTDSQKSDAESECAGSIENSEGLDETISKEKSSEAQLKEEINIECNSHSPNNETESEVPEIKIESETVDNMLNENVKSLNQTSLNKQSCETEKEQNVIYSEETSYDVSSKSNSDSSISAAQFECTESEVSDETRSPEQLSTESHLKTKINDYESNKNSTEHIQTPYKDNITSWEEQTSDIALGNNCVSPNIEDPPACTALKFESKTEDNELLENSKGLDETISREKTFGSDVTEIKLESKADDKILKGQSPETEIEQNLMSSEEKSSDMLLENNSNSQNNECKPECTESKTQCKTENNASNEDSKLPTEIISQKTISEVKSFESHTKENKTTDIPLESNLNLLNNEAPSDTTENKIEYETNDNKSNESPEQLDKIISKEPSLETQTESIQSEILPTCTQPIVESKTENNISEEQFSETMAEQNDIVLEKQCHMQPKTDDGNLKEPDETISKEYIQHNMTSSKEQSSNTHLESTSDSPLDETISQEQFLETQIDQIKPVSEKQLSIESDLQSKTEDNASTGNLQRLDETIPKEHSSKTQIEQNTMPLEEQSCDISLVNNSDLDTISDTENAISNENSNVPDEINCHELSSETQAEQIETLLEQHLSTECNLKSKTHDSNSNEQSEALVETICKDESSKTQLGQNVMSLEEQSSDIPPESNSESFNIEDLSANIESKVESNTKEDISNNTDEEIISEEQSSEAQTEQEKTTDIPLESNSYSLNNEALFDIREIEVVSKTDMEVIFTEQSTETQAEQNVISLVEKLSPSSEDESERIESKTDDMSKRNSKAPAKTQEDLSSKTQVEQNASSEEQSSDIPMESNSESSDIKAVSVCIEYKFESNIEDDISNENSKIHYENIAEQQTSEVQENTATDFSAENNFHTPNNEAASKDTEIKIETKIDDCVPNENSKVTNETISEEQSCRTQTDQNCIVSEAELFAEAKVQFKTDDENFKALDEAITSEKQTEEIVISSKEQLNDLPLQSNSESLETISKEQTLKTEIETNTTFLVKESSDILLESNLDSPEIGTPSACTNENSKSLDETIFEAHTIENETTDIRLESNLDPIKKESAPEIMESNTNDNSEQLNDIILTELPETQAEESVISMDEKSNIALESNSVSGSTENIVEGKNENNITNENSNICKKTISQEQSSDLLIENVLEESAKLPAEANEESKTDDDKLKAHDETITPEQSSETLTERSETVLEENVFTESNLQSTSADNVSKENLKVLDEIISEEEIATTTEQNAISSAEKLNSPNSKVPYIIENLKALDEAISEEKSSEAETIENKTTDIPLESNSDYPNNEVLSKVTEKKEEPVSDDNILNEIILTESSETSVEKLNSQNCEGPSEIENLKVLDESISEDKPSEAESVENETTDIPLESSSDSPNNNISSEVTENKMESKSDDNILNEIILTESSEISMEILNSQNSEAPCVIENLKVLDESISDEKPSEADIPLESNSDSPNNDVSSRVTENKVECKSDGNILNEIILTKSSEISVEKFNSQNSEAPSEIENLKALNESISDEKSPEAEPVENKISDIPLESNSDSPNNDISSEVTENKVESESDDNILNENSKPLIETTVTESSETLVEKLNSPKSEASSEIENFKVLDESISEEKSLEAESVENPTTEIPLESNSDSPNNEVLSKVTENKVESKSDDNILSENSKPLIETIVTESSERLVEKIKSPSEIENLKALDESISEDKPSEAESVENETTDIPLESNLDSPNNVISSEVTENKVESKSDDILNENLKPLIETIITESSKKTLVDKLNSPNSKTPSEMENFKVLYESISEEKSLEAESVENPTTEIILESNSDSPNNEVLSKVTENKVECKSDDNVLNEIILTESSEISVEILNSQNCEAPSEIENLKVLDESIYEAKVESKSEDNILNEIILTKSSEISVEKLNSQNSKVPSEIENLKALDNSISEEKYSEAETVENKISDIPLESNSDSPNNDISSEVTENKVESKSDDNTLSGNLKPLNEIILTESSETQVEPNIALESKSNDDNLKVSETISREDSSETQGEQNKKEQLCTESYLQSKTEDNVTNYEDQTLKTQTEQTAASSPERPSDIPLESNPDLLNSEVPSECKSNSAYNEAASDITENKGEFNTGDNTSNESSKTESIPPVIVQSSETLTEQNVLLLEEKSSDIGLESNSIKCEAIPAGAELNEESKIDNISNDNSKVSTETISQEQSFESKTEQDEIISIEQISAESNVQKTNMSETGNKRNVTPSMEQLTEKIVAEQSYSTSLNNSLGSSYIEAVSPCTVSKFDSKTEDNLSNETLKVNDELFSKEFSKNETVSEEQLSTESNLKPNIDNNVSNENSNVFVETIAKEVTSEIETKSTVIIPEEQLLDIPLEINSDFPNSEAVSACTESKIESKTEDNISLENSKVLVETISQKQSSETQIEQNETISVVQLSTGYKANDQQTSNENFEDLNKTISKDISSERQTWTERIESNSECAKNEFEFSKPDIECGVENSTNKSDKRVRDTILNAYSITNETCLKEKSFETSTEQNDTLLAKESNLQSSTDQVEQNEISSEKHSTDIPLHDNLEHTNTDPPYACMEPMTQERDKTNSELEAGQKKTISAEQTSEISSKSNAFCASSESNVQSKSNETMSQQIEVVLDERLIDNLDSTNNESLSTCTESNAESKTVDIIPTENTTVIDDTICKEQTPKIQTEQSTIVSTNLESPEIPKEESYMEPKTEYNYSDKEKAPEETISPDLSSELEMKETEIHLAKHEIGEEETSDIMSENIISNKEIITSKQSPEIPLEEISDFTNCDNDNALPEIANDLNATTEKTTTVLVETVSTKEVELDNNSDCENLSELDELIPKEHPSKTQTEQNEKVLEKQSSEIPVEDNLNCIPTEVSSEQKEQILEKQSSGILVEDNTKVSSVCLEINEQFKVETILNENSEILNDKNSKDRIAFTEQSSELQGSSDSSQNKALCACFESKSQPKSDDKILKDNSDQNNDLIGCFTRVLCPCLESNKQSKTYEAVLICQQKIDETTSFEKSASLELNVKSKTAERDLNEISKDLDDTNVKEHSSKIQQNEVIWKQQSSEIPLEVISNSTDNNALSTCLETKTEDISAEEHSIILAENIAEKLNAEIQLLHNDQSKIEETDSSNNEALYTNLEAKPEDNLAETVGNKDIKIYEITSSSNDALSPNVDSKPEDNLAETVGNKDLKINEKTSSSNDALSPNVEANPEDNLAETVGNKDLKIDEKTSSSNDALSPNLEAKPEDNLAETVGNKNLKIDEKTSSSNEALSPNLETKPEDNLAETVGNKDLEIDEKTSSNNDVLSANFKVKTEDNTPVRNSLIISEIVVVKEHSVEIQLHNEQSKIVEKPSSNDDALSPSSEAKTEDNSAEEHSLILSETVVEEHSSETRLQNNEISKEETLEYISNSSNNDKESSTKHKTEDVLDKINSKEEPVDVEPTQNIILSTDQTSEITPESISDTRGSEVPSNDMLEQINMSPVPTISAESESNSNIASESTNSIQTSDVHDKPSEAAVSLDDSPTISRQSTVVQITDEEKIEEDNNNAADLLVSATKQPPGNHNISKKLQRQYRVEDTTPSFEDISPQTMPQTTPPSTSNTLAGLCQKFIHDKHLLNALENRRRRTLLMHRFLSTLDLSNSTDDSMEETNKVHTEVLVTENPVVCESFTLSHDHDSDYEDCSDSFIFEINELDKISYNFINNILFSDQLSHDSKPYADSRANTIEEYIDTENDEKDILALNFNSNSTTNTNTTTNTTTITTTPTNSSTEISSKANTTNNRNNKTNNHKQPITNISGDPTTIATNQKYHPNDPLTSAVQNKETPKSNSQCVQQFPNNDQVNLEILTDDNGHNGIHVGVYSNGDGDHDDGASKEEEEDDDVAILRHFVPGSIAEREYKKWYNAVEMPNNPYAPEALKRRISGSQERFIDLPNISPTNDLNPLELLNNQKLDEDENSSRESDYKRYSRDYYINSSLTTPQISPARDVSARSTKDIREPTKKTLSSTETELDLYKAIPAQVVDNNSSSTDSMPLLSAEIETNTTTTSDDSDTIKMYDFETQQETKTTVKDTTVAHREQATVDEVNSKERPSSLAFSRSESGGNVITPTRGATPLAFKFLQPKRKLLEPSQVLSVEEDEQQIVSSPSEKPVIEAEVAKALPSVKALARAFLMTTNSTQPEKLWLRKARTLSQGSKKRSYSPKRSLDHLMRTDQLKPEDDLTITSDLSSLETDSSSVGVEVATSSDLTSSTNDPSLPTDTSNISPVPVRQGVLKNNIAFFENLKNK